MKKTSRIKILIRRLEKFEKALPDLQHFIAREYAHNNNLFLVENDLYIWIPSIPMLLQRVVVAERNDAGNIIALHEHTIASCIDDDFKGIEYFKSLPEVLRNLIIKYPSKFKKDTPFFVLSRQRNDELKKNFYSMGEPDFVCDMFYEMFVNNLNTYIEIESFDKEHKLISYAFI